MCAVRAVLQWRDVSHGATVTEDSAKELAALGLKLKRKQGAQFILQPCPAFKNSQCSIYAARPERCGRFECQQLKRVAAGAITEMMALEKIHTAQRRVAQINELLQRAGKRTSSTRSPSAAKKPAEPIELSANAEAMALRRQLTQTMQELNVLFE